MTTVYISIGNTDNKLSHLEWSEFYNDVDELLHHDQPYIFQVYGRWHSFPATPYVNACWSVEVDPIYVPTLQRGLSLLAHRYRQESIAFATATTEFITAPQQPELRAFPNPNSILRDAQLDPEDIPPPGAHENRFGKWCYCSDSESHR